MYIFILYTCVVYAFFNVLYACTSIYVYSSFTYTYTYKPTYMQSYIAE